MLLPIEALSRHLSKAQETNKEVSRLLSFYFILHPSSLCPIYSLDSRSREALALRTMASTGATGLVPCLKKRRSSCNSWNSYSGCHLTAGAELLRLFFS